MKLLPSEYFARQCWISFEVDERTLPLLAPVVGTDRIVWGTDYPHPDCTFPGMVKELRDTIAGLPEADQVRILWQNAVDLYRLPPT
jgi:predicted TIM-barrel fold metal-dependent hydrolase